MTLELFDEIVRRVGAGERVALCTIVGIRGSTPQVAGAKMLVLPNGRTIGTLGGGWAEDEVRHKALALLVGDGTSERISIQLDRDHCGDDAMSCGGTLDISILVCRDPLDATSFAQLAAAARSGRPATFQIADANYAERVAPPPMLIIAGAGHVAQAVAKLAADLDFRVTVIDDRAEFASVERFPTAKRIVGEIEAELAKQPIDADTYFVIATRGHARDAAALSAVIKSNAKYVGMIGSERKVKAIVQQLRTDGLSSEDLAKLHAPIGYDIGALTINEIAVSIAAELIAVRRGAAGKPAEAMKRVVGNAGTRA
jgi:xanthine dehydrogenase accessory factor